MDSERDTFSHWLAQDDQLLAARDLGAYEALCEQERGVAHPCIDHLERIAAAAAQLELELPPMDERARVRRAVAEYLERVVSPVAGSRSIAKLPERLRLARRSGRFYVRPEDGKTMIRWDDKAGLPLLCPDDAREESMRLQRRLVEEFASLYRRGRSLHTAVLTVPNSAPGDLRRGMRALWRRFSSLMRACKRKNRPFPIVGALAVMESPLGGRRDWHPHLNVIFVCDGYLDYARLRARWFHNAHFARLQGSEPKIRAALREIVKYSVRSVPEKSCAKAKAADADGRPPAPPLIEWTAVEFLEWWHAHRKFRRTRTYGCLYGVDEPEREDMSGFVAVGAVRLCGGRYVMRAPLLESIPGDKSTTPDPVQRFNAWLRPPPEAAWLLRHASRILADARAVAI